MMIRRSAWIVAFASAVVAGWWAVFGFEKVIGPLIELPDTISIGNREMGDIVVVPFSIGNRGDQELVVDQVHTSCSCTGMEQQKDGKFYRVEAMRLRPGERADLVMRVSVR